jgi:ferric hydroxamate transport system substrate-binding protein
MVMKDGAARRRFLAVAGCGAAGLALAGWRPGLAAPASASAAPAAAPRIAVLDWGLTEVVLSLGVVPAGVSRPPWYRQLDGDPPLPASVSDVGLLFQPNFEVLEALRPELIVVTPWHAPLVAALERIAPVLVVRMFGPGLDLYTAARAATLQLGATLGRHTEADALLARADRQLGECASALAGFRALRRPVYLLKPIDGRHVTVFGPHSLFGGVLHRLGLENAWQGAGDPQGNAQIDFAALAGNGDAHAAQVVMAGMPAAVAAELAKSLLWRALPFARLQRVRSIEAVPPFGGVESAMRFAREFAAAMQGVTS